MNVKNKSLSKSKLPSHGGTNVWPLIPPPFCYSFSYLILWERGKETIFLLKQKKEFIKIIILCYQPSHYCHAYPKSMTIEIKSTPNTQYYLNTITIEKRNSKDKMNKVYYT